MTKRTIIYFLFAFSWLSGIAVATSAQETITGSVFQYGSGRYTGIRTSFFTLRLKSLTPDEQAQNYLAVLQEDGQEALLRSIRDQDAGSFSLSGDLTRTVNVVREVNTGGQRKIYAVFERWELFAEVRGGYRSLDYPLGYIELTIDQATGAGSGKYFAAAKIRWKKDKKGVGSHVEIEDYATIPAKLVNVKIEGFKTL